MILSKKEWIQTKVKSDIDELKWFVRHVESPLTGKESYVEPGDHVYFMKESKIRIEVEGKKYYVMRQYRIIVLIEDSVLLEQCRGIKIGWRK